MTRALVAGLIAEEHCTACRRPRRAAPGWLYSVARHNRQPALPRRITGRHRGMRCHALRAAVPFLALALVIVTLAALAVAAQLWGWTWTR